MSDVVPFNRGRRNLAESSDRVGQVYGVIRLRPGAGWYACWYVGGLALPLCFPCTYLIVCNIGAQATLVSSVD